MVNLHRALLGPTKMNIGPIRTCILPSEKLLKQSRIAQVDIEEAYWPPFY